MQTEESSAEQRVSELLQKLQKLQSEVYVQRYRNELIKAELDAEKSRGVTLEARLSKSQKAIELLRGRSRMERKAMGEVELQNATLVKMIQKMQSDAGCVLNLDH